MKLFSTSPRRGALKLLADGPIGGRHAIAGIKNYNGSDANIVTTIGTYTIELTLDDFKTIQDWFKHKEG